MKRDPRLRGLSSEHHAALGWARRLQSRSTTPAELAARFEAELTAHFAIEERLLAPALREAGETGLADRLVREHRALRAAAEAGDAPAFGRLLEAHVRFEERELFPRCEAVLPDEVLDAVATAAPKAPVDSKRRP